MFISLAFVPITLALAFAWGAKWVPTGGLAHADCAPRQCRLGVDGVLRMRWRSKHTLLLRRTTWATTSRQGKTRLADSL